MTELHLSFVMAFYWKYKSEEKPSLSFVGCYFVERRLAGLFLTSPSMKTGCIDLGISKANVSLSH